VANRGRQVMQKQVAAVNERLDAINQTGNAWLLGGVFNLLPLGQFSLLQENQQANFRAETELEPLIENYNVISGLEDINGLRALSKKIDKKLSKS
jgi:hypothetical protein